MAAPIPVDAGKGNTPVIHYPHVTVESAGNGQSAALCSLLSPWGYQLGRAL